MDAVEAVAARERLGLSPEQLAAELGVTEKEVRAWEADRIHISKRLARQLAWRAAVAEREAALEASGLPECEWVQAWQAKPKPQKTKALTEHFEALNAHAEECSVCQARADYAEQHLPPLPDPPAPGWVNALQWFIGSVEKVPKWARPAVYGGVIVGVITLLRVVLVGLGQGFSIDLLGMALAGIGIGMYLGAVGGVAYSLVRKPFRALGRAGDYLTGIICMLAYLLAFAIPAAVLMQDPMFSDVTGWAILSFVAVLFGLIMGHTWFRDT